MPAALAVIALLSTPARALDCASGILATLPESGADGVPTNAILSLYYSDYSAPPASAEISLTDSSGAPVDILVDIEGDVLRIRPEELLSPQTGYTLEIIDDRWTRTTLPFRTGDGEDLVRPVVPELLSIERVYETDQWGERAGIAVEIAEPSEDEIFWEYEISQSEDFLDAAIVRSPFPSTLLGRDFCGESWPEYDSYPEYFIRVRAIDLAGNASDFERQRLPGDVRMGDVLFEGEGCSLAPHRGLPSLGLLPVAVLLVYRRRAHSMGMGVQRMLPV